jgi:hypothetical protein
MGSKATLQISLYELKGARGGLHITRLTQLDIEGCRPASLAHSYKLCSLAVKSLQSYTHGNIKNPGLTHRGIHADAQPSKFIRFIIIINLRHNVLW